MPKVNDRGCKHNAKQKFANVSSFTEDSANGVCSLNAGKPFSTEGLEN